MVKALLPLPRHSPSLPRKLREHGDSWAEALLLLPLPIKMGGLAPSSFAIYPGGK